MFNHKKIENYIGRISYDIVEWVNYLRTSIKSGTLENFKDILIETITTCNRRCSYCPNSIFDRGLSENQQLMDEKLFKKIIDELAEIRFSGRISPHSYGEPLLDKRLVSFIRYAREKLPISNIIIFSNGDYLTIDLFNKLLDAGVNSFLITQHSPKMPKNIKLLFDHLEEYPLKKVHIHYQKVTDESLLSNRGGLVAPPKIESIPRCQLPDNPLVIDFKGDVILCCNDYHGSVVFGNLKENKLIDIWKSKKFKQIRRELKKGNFNLPICKKCTGNLTA